MYYESSTTFLSLSIVPDRILQSFKLKTRQSTVLSYLESDGSPVFVSLNFGNVQSGVCTEGGDYTEKQEQTGCQSNM